MVPDSSFVFGFFYNILICTKEFLDIIWAKMLGRKQTTWAKTDLFGNRNPQISTIRLGGKDYAFRNIAYFRHNSVGNSNVNIGDVLAHSYRT